MTDGRIFLSVLTHMGRTTGNTDCTCLDAYKLNVKAAERFFAPKGRGMHSARGNTGSLQRNSHRPKSAAWVWKQPDDVTE
jgi:hypothetical protein